MAVPAIVLNLQGQILDANETALDLVGLPSQDVIGKWIGRFLTGEDLPEILDSLQLIAQQCTRKVIRVSLRNAAGHVIPMLIDGSALRDDQCRVIGAIGILKPMQTQLPAA